MSHDLSKEHINAIYDEYKHFNIIGLTGRYGSGCTAASKLLNDFNFDPNTIYPYNETSDEYIFNKDKLICNSERERKILLNFAKKNDIFSYHVIRINDIITSYILEDLSSLYSILEATYEIIDTKDKIERFMREEYNLELSSLSNKSKAIWATLAETDLISSIKKMSLEDYHFLFNETTKISKAFFDFLGKEINIKAATILYQYIGNALRIFGFLSPDNIDFKRKYENPYAISKRIDILIKILHKRDWINGKKKRFDENSSVRVVIDRFTNILDVNYFKSKHQSFYLLAITTDESHRYHRLFQKNFSGNDVSLIDFWEQSLRAKKEFKKVKSSILEIYKRYDYNQLHENLFKNESYLFNLANVDYCIQNADIFISNNSRIDYLNQELFRYVCLMMHPGLITPTIDERYMQIAQTAKLSSGCISRQVGAVICDVRKNILSVGWNEPAATLENECIPCIKRNLSDLCEKKDSFAYSFYELNNMDFRNHIKNAMLNKIKKKGVSIKKLKSLELFDVYKKFTELYDEEIDGLPMLYCFKDVYCSLIDENNQVHTRSQHAEEKAFENCDKFKTKGGTLYTTSSSCELCAKKALSYNISRIVYIEPYSGITNEHVLGQRVEHGYGNECFTEEGIPTTTYSVPIQVELFTGATQYAYIKLYAPLLPMKDELELRGINIK